MKKNITVSLIIFFILICTINVVMAVENKGNMQITYTSHVQDIGWQNWKTDGELSGTEGKSLRLEAMKIKLNNNTAGIKIKYQTHIQDIGWQNWKTDGELSGTEGKSLRLEAIKIKLEETEDYSVMYRVHIQDIGWQDWKADGEIAGTEGKSLRLEAIEIKLVDKIKKGTLHIDDGKNGETYYNVNKIDFNGWKMANVSNTKVNVYINDSKTPIEENRITYTERKDVINAIKDYGTEKENPKPGFMLSIDSKELKEGNNKIEYQLVDKNGKVIQTNITNIKLYNEIHVTYQSHVQEVGWQSWKTDGETSGTEGKSLRVEALNIKLINNSKDVKIKYKTHVQDIGWQDWKTEGKIAGTEGRSLRVEAIRIQLENCDEYSIEYRTHVQDIGWTDWKIDGEVSGTEGKNLRIEAIQIRLVPKYKRYYKGIDVSRWQGKIDFDTLVKSNQIDFMIARIGWYSTSQSKLIVDTQFERNYKEAKARKLPLGAYVYSYATSVEEAKEEAEAVVEYLKSTNQNNYELPIFYDLEDDSQISLGKDTLSQMAISFGEILKKAGYKVGVYSYSYWLDSYMDLSKIPNDYALWIADYGSDSSGKLPDDIYKYAQNHDIWQYTDSGKVDGIEGTVDMNICYKKYF